MNEGGTGHVPGASTEALTMQMASATAHPVVLREHHPQATEYVIIAIVLSALTLIEVGVYYTEPLHVYLTAVLLVLSAVKFVLVVAFYMHLKFDNRLFAALFSLGLIIAGSLMISLLFLFRSYFVEALLHAQ